MTEATGSPATGGMADGLAGMLNVFVDPAATARRVPSKLSWVWPVVVLVVVYMIISYLMTPYTLQLMDATLTQREMPADAMERTRSAMHTTARVTAYLTPIFVLGFLALFAWLIKVGYAVMDVRPRFRDVFSLLAACSLIPMLQYIATYIVLRAKGDVIDNPTQMTPPFGLDIFFPSLHGPLLAILGFFSLFQIWFIIVLVFGLASLTGSSKMKAFIASTPAWLIPLFFRVIGSLFQKAP